MNNEIEVNNHTEYLFKRKEKEEINNEIEVISYTEFIPESEILQFENDMEEGEYHDWIDEYPEHTLAIFGAFLHFGGKFVTEADILYFLNEGVNLNFVTDAYPDDVFTTPLIYACSRTNKQLVEILIRLGANVNQKVADITPLEATLIGAPGCAVDTSDLKEIEVCFKLLLDAGAKPEIRSVVFDEYYKEYMEESEYLKSVLEKIKIVED